LESIIGLLKSLKIRALPANMGDTEIKRTKREVRKVAILAVLAQGGRRAGVSFNTFSRNMSNI
jgi:hypothetical protein